MISPSLPLRYRPLRIGWCVPEGDFGGLRAAWALTHTMWGGPFNPIIPVAQQEATERLVTAFRPDVLLSLSDDQQVQAFIDAFPQFSIVGFGRPLFLGSGTGRVPSVLDISHPARKIAAQREKRRPFSAIDVSLYDWQEQDPLADFFRMLFGELPAPSTIGVDYRGLLVDQFHATPVTVDPGAPVRIADGIVGVSGLALYEIAPLQTAPPGTTDDGFFVGSLSRFDDLVNCWNLNAAGRSLIFLDAAYMARLGGLKDYFAGILSAGSDPRFSWAPPYSVWGRDQDLAARVLGTSNKGVFRQIQEKYWQSDGSSVPTMYFSRTSSMGVLGQAGQETRFSIQLTEKPFDPTHAHFNEQLVVSIDTSLTPMDGSAETLAVPNLPALNRYYGESFSFRPDRARAETDGIGLITSATQPALYVGSLKVPELISRIFGLAAIGTELGKPGLIAKRVIQQMGGLTGCRAFKIAGVRALIEDFGPDQSFTRSNAIDRIRADLGRHQTLFIEPRAPGHDLKAGAVFRHLLDKGLFRVGLELSCPSCELQPWISLDDLRTPTPCVYCGQLFNPVPQLKDRDWRYRRSGIFGNKDNQEGSIPVTLLLQQLEAQFPLSGFLYSTATKLSLSTGIVRECETDFVVVAPHSSDGRVGVAIGECKTRGAIEIDDVKKLGTVAESLRAKGMDVFVVFAKLGSFGGAELEAAASLNTAREKTVILLNAADLESEQPFEDLATELCIPTPTLGSFQGMAAFTDLAYFSASSPPPQT